MKCLRDERLYMEKNNKQNERMKVIEYIDANKILVEFQDKYKGTIWTCWNSFINGVIENPNAELLGTKRRNGNYVDLTGQVFGRLTVLYESKKKRTSKRIYWVCRCSCEDKTIVEVDTNSLKKGHTKSCGCLLRETASIRKKGIRGPRRFYNTYDLSGEYGIGYTEKNESFLFDLEDYDKIKDYYWSIHNGYVRGYIDANNRDVLMHRYVLGINDPRIEVDHIGHNTVDNRKNKLRITTNGENHQNLTVSKNNKSGTTGVCCENGRWRAYIWHNKKTIHLGTYKTKEEAIEARLKAEEEIFGDYGYKRSIAIYNQI